MSEQADMFPDMPYKDADDFSRPLTPETVWFYVNHSAQDRMLSCDPFTGETVFIPFDLACPRIMLFNTKAVAQRYADQDGGFVVQYPYKLDHFYSR